MLHLRLACVRPAASVRSEPGSNSQINLAKTSARKPPRKTENQPKLQLSEGSDRVLHVSLNQSRPGKSLHPTQTSKSSVLRAFAASRTPKQKNTKPPSQSPPNTREPTKKSAPLPAHPFRSHLTNNVKKPGLAPRFRDPETESSAARGAPPARCGAVI